MVGTIVRAETEAGRKWQEDTHGRLDLVLLNIPHIFIFLTVFVALDYNNWLILP